MPKTKNRCAECGIVLPALALDNSEELCVLCRYRLQRAK